MRADISIIIPTLNAETELVPCLESLMEGVMDGLIRELIVTDGGSSDKTLEIAEDAGARIVHGAASRGGQLRRGVKASVGGWVLVLHADTRLSRGWAQAVRAHLDDNCKDPAAFRLAFRASGFAPSFVSRWANLRSVLFRLPYGDQGLLVRRSQYEKAGGFPDQPLTEDVALVRALKARPLLLDVVASTSAERFEKVGWLRRGARNLITLARYLAGADPAKLADSYRR